MKNFQANKMNKTRPLGQPETRWIGIITKDR